MTETAPNDSIDILYEHRSVVVINKPGGLLTQAPPGIDSLEWRLRRLLKQRQPDANKHYIGVPHRLDRPVSGAIVMARNVRAANRISAQIENRSVTKTYWAIVEGQLDQPSGQWIDFMRKIPDQSKSEMVPSDHADAKQAVLNYRLKGQAEGLSWLEIELQTGRTHQIRLQCGSRNLPIIGDFLYGAQQPFGPQVIDQRQQWIGLHARHLVFQHPIESETVDVTAAIGAHWLEFADKFRM